MFIYSTVTSAASLARYVTDAHYRPALCRRKSPQWFGLRREAAEVVVHDQDFLDVMREFCVADQMIDGRCGAGADPFESPLTAFLNPFLSLRDTGSHLTACVTLGAAPMQWAPKSLAATQVVRLLHRRALRAVAARLQGGAGASGQQPLPSLIAAALLSCMQCCWTWVLWAKAKNTVT